MAASLEWSDGQQIDGSRSSYWFSVRPRPAISTQLYPRISVETSETFPPLRNRLTASPRIRSHQPLPERLESQLLNAVEASTTRTTVVAAFLWNIPRHILLSQPNAKRSVNFRVSRSQRPSNLASLALREQEETGRANLHAINMSADHLLEISFIQRKQAIGFGSQSRQ